MINLKKVNKIFKLSSGDIEAVKNVNLVIKKGEFVIIIEPKQDTLIEKSYTTAIKNLILKEYSNKDIVDLIKPISTDSKKEIYKIVLSIRQGE